VSTAAALGAASEAVINLASRARSNVTARHRRAHVAVGKDVARADNHQGLDSQLVQSATIF
jgi:hypothetical protein